MEMCQEHGRDLAQRHTEWGQRNRDLTTEGRHVAGFNRSGHGPTRGPTSNSGTDQDVDNRWNDDEQPDERIRV